MTDSDSNPIPAPRPRTLPWVLVALGVAFALAGVWFALSGGSHDAGPAATTATGAVVAPQLTDADVDAVLGEIDYAQASDTSTAEYDNAVARMLRGIDLPAFAHATLTATDTITWTDMGAAASRQVTGDEKSGFVTESDTYWHKLRDLSGSDEEPLADLLGLRFYPPTVADRNRSDSLLEVTAQGLKPLSLMFGARTAENRWTWRVTSVSVTGTDTADVTYSASAAPDAGWKFANPDARYVKHLRFSYDAEKRWRLSAWTNYPAVYAQFRANLVPSNAVVRVEKWWSAL